MTSRQNVASNKVDLRNGCRGEAEQVRLITRLAWSCTLAEAPADADAGGTDLENRILAPGLALETHEQLPAEVTLYWFAQRVSAGSAGHAERTEKTRGDTADMRRKTRTEKPESRCGPIFGARVTPQTGRYMKTSTKAGSEIGPHLRAAKLSVWRTALSITWAPCASERKRMPQSMTTTRCLTGACRYAFWGLAILSMSSGPKNDVTHRSLAGTSLSVT